MDLHSSTYLKELFNTLHKTDFQKIDLLKTKLKSFINKDVTLFVCGNGGSASTSSHMCCDLSKTILKQNPRFNNKRMRVICLNDNMPLLTAWGNDEGYEYIFSQQLKNLGKKGDLLIVITGSGNSANILEVVRQAREMKIKTFAFLGFDGGKVKNMVDDYVLINSNNYGIIEDAHHFLNHLITDYLKKNS